MQALTVTNIKAPTYNYIIKVKLGKIKSIVEAEIDLILTWFLNKMSSSSNISLTPSNSSCNHPRVGVGVFVVRGNKFLIGKRKGSHCSGRFIKHGKCYQLLNFFNI
jgi:hypothetical protein